MQYEGKEEEAFGLFFFLNVFHFVRKTDGSVPGANEFK